MTEPGTWYPPRKVCVVSIVGSAYFSGCCPLSPWPSWPFEPFSQTTPFGRKGGRERWCCAGRAGGNLHCLILAPPREGGAPVCRTSGQGTCGSPGRGQPFTNPTGALGRCRIYLYNNSIPSDSFTSLRPFSPMKPRRGRNNKVIPPGNRALNARIGLAFPCRVPQIKL